MTRITTTGNGFYSEDIWNLIHLVQGQKQTWTTEYKTELQTKLEKLFEEQEK